MYINPRIAAATELQVLLQRQHTVGDIDFFVRLQRSEKHMNLHVQTI